MEGEGEGEVGQALGQRRAGLWGQQPRRAAGRVPEPRSLPDRWAQRMRVQGQLLRHFVKPGAPPPAFSSAVPKRIASNKARRCSRGAPLGLDCLGPK